MKIAAYVLFVLQAVAIFGSVNSGDFSRLIGNAITGGIPGIAGLLGYFLPAIAGFILLSRYNKKHNSWTCASCSTRNSNSIQACKKCGTHK